MSAKGGINRFRLREKTAKGKEEKDETLSLCLAFQFFQVFFNFAQEKDAQRHLQALVRILRLEDESDPAS